MSCKYHSEREEVAKCNVCGAPLCNECEKFQKKFATCVKCSEHEVKNIYGKFKRGLCLNIFTILCAITFLVMFIIESVNGNLTQAFFIIGIVVVAIMIPLSVLFLVFTIINIKKYKSYLELI